MNKEQTITVNARVKKKMAQEMWKLHLIIKDASLTPEEKLLKINEEVMKWL